MLSSLLTAKLVVVAFAAVSMLVVTASDHQPSSVQWRSCPTSASPVTSFDVDKLTGRWLDTYTTFVLSKEGNTNKAKNRCVETVFHVDSSDGSVYLNRSFFDQNGIRREAAQKWIPVPGQNGTFTTLKLSQDGHSWVYNIWRYSILDVQQDSFLEYACASLPTAIRRKSFHRIRSRVASIPTESLEKLVQRIREANDKNQLIVYDQNNCDYN